MGNIINQKHICMDVGCIKERPAKIFVTEQELKQYEVKVEELECMGNFKVEAFKPISGPSPHYGLTIGQMRSSLYLFCNKL